MITLSPCIRTSGALHTNPDTGVEYGIGYFRMGFVRTSNR